MRAGIMASALRPPRPFDPASITGLDLWLRSEDLTHLADGDPIAHWADSSPAGNHATQPNSANMPTFSNAKGFPSVWFSGSFNHYLATPVSASDPSQTAFVVVTVEDDTVRTPLGASATIAFALDTATLRRVQARTWGRGGVVFQPLPPPAGTIFAYGGMLDASTTSLSVWRGLRPAYTNNESGALTAGRTLRIGIKGTSAERHYGHIFEIIHYSRALTEPERMDVMGYLMTKYGIVDGA